MMEALGRGTWWDKSASSPAKLHGDCLHIVNIDAAHSRLRLQASNGCKMHFAAELDAISHTDVFRSHQHFLSSVQALNQ